MFPDLASENKRVNAQPTFFLIYHIIIIIIIIIIIYLFIYLFVCFRYYSHILWGAVQWNRS